MNDADLGFIPDAPPAPVAAKDDFGFVADSPPQSPPRVFPQGRPLPDVNIAPEDPGAPDSFGRQIGTALSYAGGVAKSAIQDLGEAAGRVAGITPVQPNANLGRNLASAVTGNQATNQTPYDAETGGVDGWQGLLKNVSNGIAETIPKLFIAGRIGKVLEAGGTLPLAAHSIAAGTTFGFTDQGFSPVQAAIMAAFPAVGKYGGDAAIGALGKLGVKFESGIAENAFHSLGSLIASQAYLDVTSLKDYADMPPEEAKKHWVENFATNLAFHLAGVPGVIQGGIAKDKATKEQTKLEVEAKLQASKVADTFWDQVNAKKAPQPDDVAEAVKQFSPTQPPIDLRKGKQPVLATPPPIPEAASVEPAAVAPPIAPAPVPAAVAPVPAAPVVPPVVDVKDSVPVEQSKPSSGRITFESYDEPSGKWVQNDRKVVISKSTIPGDKPWRVTVFAGGDESPVPIGHVQLDSPTEATSNKSLSELAEQLGRHVRNIDIKTGLATGDSTKPVTPPAPVETPKSTTPDPAWRVTVQAPQPMGDQTVPGFVQVDSIKDGKNEWSAGPEKLKAQGIDIPDFSKLPQGTYTYAEAVKKLAEPIKAGVVTPVDSAKSGREVAGGMNEPANDFKEYQDLLAKQRMSDWDGKVAISKQLKAIRDRNDGMPPQAPASMVLPEPVVVTGYHGTRKKGLTALEIGSQGYFGRGIYVGKNKTGVAGKYGKGGELIPVRVTLRKPFDLTKTMVSADEANAIFDDAHEWDINSTPYHSNHWERLATAEATVRPQRFTEPVSAADIYRKFVKHSEIMGGGSPAQSGGTALSEIIQRYGYDGVIHPTDRSGGVNSESKDLAYVAFDPRQVQIARNPPAEVPPVEVPAANVEVPPEASRIATYKGENGMSASVYKIDKGYSVVLKDENSGNKMPTIRIFPTLLEARNYAKTIEAKVEVPITTERLQIPEKATSLKKGAEKLAPEAAELLNKIVLNKISSFVGHHDQLNRYLLHDAPDIARVENDRYIIRTVPDPRYPGSSFHVVESKSKPGFPVVTGSWMDFWEPFMKKDYGVSKADYDKLDEGKRAEIELRRQLDYWLDPKRDWFADNFFRTYHPDQWEAYMEANKSPSKELAGFMEKPFSKRSTIEHWKKLLAQTLTPNPKEVTQHGQDEKGKKEGQVLGTPAPTEKPIPAASVAGVIPKSGKGKVEIAPDAIIDYIEGQIGKIKLWRPSNIKMAQLKQLERKKAMLTIPQQRQYRKLKEETKPPAGFEGFYTEGYRQALKEYPQLFSPDGSAPDSIVDALRRAGIVKDDYSHDDLYDTILGHAKVRKGAKENQSREQKILSGDEAALVEFENLALHNKERTPAEQKKTPAVWMGTMDVGDTFTLKGEKFTITSYDGDNDAFVVQDGQKFGRQMLYAHDAFFPDAKSVVKAPAPEEPPTPEEQPKEVVKQEGKAKVGQEILFIPKAELKRTHGEVRGDVTEVIHNDDGEVGYHVHSPTPDDPSRVLRVWERDGAIAISTGKIAGADRTAFFERSNITNGKTATKEFLKAVNEKFPTETITHYLKLGVVEVLVNGEKRIFSWSGKDTNQWYDITTKAVEELPKGQFVPPEQKVQTRPLTKKEQGEFEDLSLKIRAHRESGGPQLTTEETQRYEHLTALAGQMDLLGGVDNRSGALSRIKQLREKADEMDRLRARTIQRYHDAYGAHAETLMKEAAVYAKQASEARIQASELEHNLDRDPNAKAPADDLGLDLEQKPKEAADAPGLDFGDNHPFSLTDTGTESDMKAGSAKGIEDIKKLLDQSGLTPGAIQVAQAMLDSRVMRTLNWSRLKLELDPGEQDFAGEAFVRNGLIRMSSMATPKTFPHEVFHFLHELLPGEYKQAIEQARIAAIKEEFGDNVPDHLIDGTMTSDEFVAAGLPVDTYHLINPREFLSEFASDKFAAEVFNKRNDNRQPAGFWEGLHAKVKEWLKAIIDTVKRFGKVNPDMDSIYKALLDGKWKPSPDSGMIFDRERQASLVRNTREFQKQKDFGEQAVGERTMAAHGDLVELKRREADAIGATDKARAAVLLPQHEFLTQMAGADIHYSRAVFGNYKEMRKRTEGSDMGRRSGVILDAWRGLGFEQRRAEKLRGQLAAQEALVKSEAFQDRIKRMFTKEGEAKLAKQTIETFQHQISQQAGDVIRELDERGKTEAAYEQLRSDLKRLEQLPDFSEAVRQRVQDIVDTIAATEAGFRVLSQTDKPLESTEVALNPDLPKPDRFKNGTEIYRTYLDLKESTSDRPKAGLAGMVDPSMLSAGDREKVRASSAPALSSSDKAFAQLASQILAANTDLRLKLSTLAHFKFNPEFQASVTKVGEDFRKQFEANPNNAIKQMLKTAVGMKAKELNAKAAWLRLHRDIMPELKKYQTLSQAVEIDNRVMASPEWKQLVNQIHEDAGAERIPDSELAHVTKENIWNEFTGKQSFRSPNGGQYDVDLGFTKRSAAEAQRQMGMYLADVNGWLDNPENATSPDRKYWQMRYDFVDNVLNVSTALSPTSTIALGVQHGFTIPEFFFKSASLPQAKVTFTAFNNFTRAWVVADQWYNGAAPVMIDALVRGMRSHTKGLVKSLFSPTYDVNTDIRDYQRDVIDRLASEYRHGNALAAGDRLNNGLILTPADMVAFKAQGQHLRQLFQIQKNIAREKVMVDNLLLDEWAKNVFGLRAPQELGAEPGTTLPHEFSKRSSNLARMVAKIAPGDFNALTRLFNSEDHFDQFVARFIAERRADYTEKTPIEDIYKDMARDIRYSDPEAPTTVEEAVDYIDSHTTGKYDREQIEAMFIGGMEKQLRKFYKDFVQKDDAATDVRALRAVKKSAFTSGFHRDVGSSFFYEYGSVTAPEIRSTGIDSVNFHLVRLVRSMDAAETAYRDSLAELETAVDPKKATAKGMADFASGADFRNWERLKSELHQISYFKSKVPAAYGSQGVQSLDLFSNANRLVGDFVGTALSGVNTVANVLFGSVVKMGSILGGMNDFYMGAYAKGAVSTLMSMARYAPRILGAPVLIPHKFFSSKESGTGKLKDALSQYLEQVYRQGTYFNQQYDYGLGFKNPVGYRLANILALPYSHGQGFDPKLSANMLVRGVQKVGFRALSLAELPLELIKGTMPQLGYAISYDAAARAAAWTLDGIASQARRSFEYHEKRGTLSRFDLNNPSAIGNLLPVEQIVPRGLFPKTQTNLNFARDWWQRALDVPLNETVIKYWKALSETPKDKRGEVSFLAAEEKDPAKVQHLEDARGGALMSILLKDVHHASPENRPMELRMNPVLRSMFPLVGWFSQSTRGAFQSLGRASSDPQRNTMHLRLMAAGTILGFLAASIAGGEAEKGIKKLIARFLYHEETPTKMLNRAEDKVELAKMAALDTTSFIPILHDWFATLLGEKQGGTGQGGIAIFTVQKINDLLGYFNGVIKTGDPTYGLSTLSKKQIPLTKVLINQLESQKGLIAQRDARTLMKLYGPQDLIEKGADGAMHPPTPLTPFKIDLANAIFSGDQDGITIAADAFTKKAIMLGKTPEEADKLLRQALTSMNPLLAGGSKMTEEQRAEYLAKLKGAEVGKVATAEERWNIAEAQLGTGVASTKREPGSGGGGGSAPPAMGGGRTGGGGASGNFLRNRSRTNRLRSSSSRPRSSGSFPRMPRVAALRQSSSRSRGRRTNRLRSRRSRR